MIALWISLALAGEPEVGGRLRTGWTTRFLEAGDVNRDHTTFFVDQARMGVRGEVAGDWAYDMQIEVAQGLLEPKDLALTWSPLWWADLQVGQFKAPFSWDLLQSKGKFSFADRPSLTSDGVPGRDVGAMFIAHSERGRAAASLGAFTGQGANTDRDDEAGIPLLVGRAMIQPLAGVHPGHGDVRRTGRPALGLGVSGAWTREAASETFGAYGPLTGTRLSLGADAVFKYRGLFLEAEYIEAASKPDVGEPSRGGGVLVQGAYYCARVRSEVALRYEHFNPSSLRVDDQERTANAALNVYPVGNHDLKLTLDFRHRLPRQGEVQGWKEDDLALITQLQF